MFGDLEILSLVNLRSDSQIARVERDPFMWYKTSSVSVPELMAAKIAGRAARTAGGADMAAELPKIQKH